MRRLSAATAIIVLGATATVGVTSPADASVVALDGTGVIILGDRTGEANHVSVNWGNNPTAESTISDHANITAWSQGCEMSDLGYLFCPGSSYVLLLGPLDDHGESINSEAAGTTTQMYGEDGNDRLSSGAGSDVLDGGPGDDVLSPDGDHPGPGDVVSGGTGVDRLDLAGTVATSVYASLDGVANDGHDRTDNYAADLEDIVGARDGRNVLVGNAAANTIEGRDQDDVLQGLAGADSLIGNDGFDVIDAVDRSPGDKVDCGRGTDTAYVDRGDLVDGCETVVTTSAPPPLPGAASVATVGGKRLDANRARTKARLKVACSAGPTRCAGKVVVKARGRPLGRGRFDIHAASKEGVRIRLTGTARAALRAAPKRKAKVTLAADTGAVITKKVLLTR